MTESLEHVTNEHLEADIVGLAENLTRRLQRWLTLVAEFDRRGAARRWGFRGTAEWLAWRCGLSARAARDHVRVARGLAHRPHVRAAFASGELSYSKVRALVRAPAGDDDTGLVDLARRSTAAQLERVVRGLRTAPSADVDVANQSHARRFVDWWWEEDGSLSLRGRLPAEDGAAFIEAVETAAAALHGVAARSEAVPAGGSMTEPAHRLPDAAGAPPPEAPPPLGARRADALTEIAISGSPRALVVLHVDEPALACTARAASERAGETCALEDGPALPSEIARRLACDGEIVLAHRSSDGRLDHGRRRRVVSPALRTALERRDRGCRFPGCDRRHDLHAHHVRHWAHGGRTDKENLVLVCRFHHRLLHEEGFSVRSAGANAFSFSGPDGRRIPDAPAPRLVGQPPAGTTAVRAEPVAVAA